MGLRESQKDRRRARIVAAAGELLRERGIEGLAIREVAERAEVAPATIYNLIGGQNRVAAALVTAAIDAIPFARPDLACMEPLDRVIAHLASVFESFEARAPEVRPVIRLYLARRGTPDWDAERPLAPLFELGLATYGGWIAEARAAGAFAPEVPADAVAAALMSTLKAHVDAWALASEGAGLVAASAVRAGAIVLLSGALGLVRARLTAMAGGAA